MQCIEIWFSEICAGLSTASFKPVFTFELPLLQSGKLLNNSETPIETNQIKKIL